MRQSNAFIDCLKSRKITRFNRAGEKVNLEIKAAKNDLRDAKDLLKQGKIKFATVAGYYALFHSARALLYSRGYRERSHFCLKVAINELFVRERLMSLEYIDYFDNAIGLREAADYESDYSKTGAKKAIRGAEKFLIVCLEILDKK